MLIREVGPVGNGRRRILVRIPGRKGSWPVSRVLWNALRHSGSHSSGPAVTCWLKQPTRGQREQRYCPPIWSCSGWGLPCRFCYQKRGGLLPGSLATVRALAGHAPFHPRLIRHPSLRERDLRPYGRKVGYRPSAVYSLWHFPSPRGVRSLTGILLCGARTFLYASELHSDCPASFEMYSTRCMTCSRTEIALNVGRPSHISCNSEPKLCR